MNININLNLPSYSYVHYSEARGHRQPSIFKQLCDTLSLSSKDTNTALEGQRDAIAGLANARTQVVECIGKLLLVHLHAVALALAPTPALAHTFALTVGIVVNFSLELVDDTLCVEDTLCDLELAARNTMSTTT